MHPAEILLQQLERTNTHNKSWQSYIARHAQEVQQFIDWLRWFASRKPGRVADACNARADALQGRVDRLDGGKDG